MKIGRTNGVKHVSIPATASDLECILCEMGHGCLRFLSYASFLAALLWAVTSFAVTNNVALTPPMGWNDWNSYACSISEADVTNTINLVATNGMKAAGYQFINIDDGWASSRNSSGVIQAYSLAGKFPDGIPFLANYAHSNGLKLGIYTDHGTTTCSSCISGQTPPEQPGSYGYEYVDAFTYASWNVDYLKEDTCNVPANAVAEVDYGKMSDGLMKSGQPIVFSLCGGAPVNVRQYQSWSPVLGNYWRTTGDISDSYSSMISHIDPNSATAFAAGPGRWNDPDMLEVGNGGMTVTQDQTHFTMWCIMAAPLIMGNNLTTMSAQALATLTNPEAIAVDQDLAGEEGVKEVNNINSVGTNEVWSRTLGYDFSTKAVVLFNREGPATNITVNWTNIGLQAGTATVRDLWAHADLGAFTNSFTTNVAVNAAVMLKVVGTPPVLPGLGANYLTDLQAVYAYTGYGTIVNDKSIGGNTITLNGVTYPKGIGVNAFAGSDYDLGGICSRFQATIGVDDEVGANGTVIFQVFADGMEIYNSGVMVGGGPSQTINLDVTGVRRLILGVDDADDNINFDHGDWADALVIVSNTTPQLPYAPAGVVASPGDAITLTWNSALAANTYNVQRATNSGGPYTIITNVPITTFTDSNVAVAATYYYVVSSVNITGAGSNSVEVSATPCHLPAVPANVMTAASSSAVIVTWNASPGATSYNVERFTPGTPPVVIASEVAATNFTDTAVAQGETNYYLVSALNDCNQSGWSAFAAAVIPLPPPPAVYWTNLITTAAQSWNINANWTNSAAFPNSANVLAVVSDNITAPQTINLNQSITVCSLNIGAANGLAAYTIAANGGSLRFNGTTNTIVLTQLASSRGDVLAATVFLLANLVVINNSANPLTLAGTLLSSGGALTLGGGVLQVGNGTVGGSLGAVAVTNNGALVFDCNNNVTTSGVISGSGALAQNGTGTMTLSAIDTYSGPTMVNGGTLALGSAGSLSNSASIYVAPGATFNASGRSDGTLSLPGGQTLAGGGNITGVLTSTLGSTVAPGSASATGTLTVSGAVMLQGTTFMKLNPSASTNDVVGGSSITYGGTLNLTNLAGAFAAGNTFKLFSAATYSGSFTNLTPAIPVTGLGWSTNNLPVNGTLSVIAQPTPPPHFGGIVTNGNNLVISGTNGVPNWTYYVLTSTNVSLPLSNWTVIATNTFDGGGNFNFTNSPNPPAPQTFYLLKLQ
jgi:alpha-galactosidase